MEDKDIELIEEKINKGYIYVNCGNATEKAIINLLQAYKQDEKVINKIEDKIDKFDYEFEKAKRKNDEDRANYYWDLIRNFKKVLEIEE